MIVVKGNFKFFLFVKWILGEIYENIFGFFFSFSVHFFLYIFAKMVQFSVKQTVNVCTAHYIYVRRGKKMKKSMGPSIKDVHKN